MIAAAEDLEMLEASTAPDKFGRADAIGVARELLIALAPVCESVMVAGSLRRRKAVVGDVELLFIPQMTDGPRTDLLLPPVKIARTNAVIGELLARGVLAKRLSVKGTPAWGEKNKLAVHVASGIPVDLFAATTGNWWNYVVCRTGGKQSNIAICEAAKKSGWKWNPYGDGFSRAAGLGREVHAVTSEREVFAFAGLPWLEPWERK